MPTHQVSLLAPEAGVWPRSAAPKTIVVVVDYGGRHAGSTGHPEPPLPSANSKQSMRVNTTGPPGGPGRAASGRA